MIKYSEKNSICMDFNKCVLSENKIATLILSLT